MTPAADGKQRPHNDQIGRPGHGAASQPKQHTEETQEEVKVTTAAIRQWRATQESCHQTDCFHHLRAGDGVIAGVVERHHVNQCRVGNAKREPLETLQTEVSDIWLTPLLKPLRVCYVMQCSHQSDVNQEHRSGFDHAQSTSDDEIRPKV